MVLSPDNKTLILGGVGGRGGAIALVDWGKKEIRAKWQWEQPNASALALSPDGKMLAVRGTGAPVTLRDTVSGALRLEIAEPGEVQSFAFSPDGKTLALGTRKGTLDIWETASGKLRCRFTGYQRSVEALAFSPDGRTLVSGSADTTILVWDVTGLCKDGELSSAQLAAKDLVSLWEDLASADGLTAHRAIWKLVAGGKQSVRFLQQHLPPAARLEAAELKRLLADLDADRFAVRQQAVEALAKLHDRARDGLEQVLSGKPTLELRKRVELLLKRLDGPVTLKEVCRGLRALEVLEQIGTAEARQLLTALTKGLPQARVTQEAQASLKRLARRPLITP
jgi:hypothetical protein